MDPAFAVCQKQGGGGRVTGPSSSLPEVAGISKKEEIHLLLSPLFSIDETGEGGLLQRGGGGSPVSGRWTVGGEGGPAEFSERDKREEEEEEEEYPPTKNFSRRWRPLPPPPPPPTKENSIFGGEKGGGEWEGERGERRAIVPMRQFALSLLPSLSMCVAASTTYERTRLVEQQHFFFPVRIFCALFGGETRGEGGVGD